MDAAQQITDRQELKVFDAALLMLTAGVIHFIVMPSQWEHAPAHGIMMGVIGALQVIWAAAYWLRPSRRLAQLGVILAVSMIALWMITRVAPAPFTNEAEAVDLGGVVSKLVEALAAGVLAAVLAKPAHPSGASQSPRKTLITLFLVSVLLAVGVYAAARAVQPLFPQLGSPPHGEAMQDHP